MRLVHCPVITPGVVIVWVPCWQGVRYRGLISFIVGKRDGVKLSLLMSRGCRWSKLVNVKFCGGRETGII